MAFVRKVYGQSKQESCAFCGGKAFSENSQGFAVCNAHKTKVMEDKKCVCGEYLDVKKSKWGAFFLCSKCGPISLSKANSAAIEEPGFKLNKKYREEKKAVEKEISNKPKPVNYEKDRVYTLDELEALWD